MLYVIGCLVPENYDIYYEDNNSWRKSIWYKKTQHMSDLKKHINAKQGGDQPYCKPLLDTFALIVLIMKEPGYEILENVIAISSITSVNLYRCFLGGELKIVRSMQ
ncbi:MAG: hypothetical protein SFT93_00075 [Rickettsiaceae bacterium]|nr:hypothetical protein [Rickettsiaceae bacterium]